MNIIVAMSENNVIGLQGKMPWHLSEDLKHFKQITMGHTIVMGRKTYESIGKPLPGRTNVVITRQKDFKADGVTVVHDFKEILGAGAGHAPENFGLTPSTLTNDVFIIGGAEIYNLALPHVDKIYITLIHKKIEGDTFFPPINLDCDYKLIEKSEMFYSEKEKLPYQFIVAKRCR